MKTHAIYMFGIITLLVMQFFFSSSPSVATPVKVATSHSSNDSSVVTLYFNYCIKAKCLRTDTCCQAIEDCNDSMHDYDCPIYKRFLKRITPKVKK